MKVRERNHWFMKILIVSATLPSPRWGASARNFHLLKALARQHAVALLTVINDTEMGALDDLRLLEAFTQHVQTIPLRVQRAKRQRQLLSVARRRSYLLNLFILPEMQAALDAMLARESYDLVLFESVLMAGYRLPAGMKVVIDQHNLEFEILQRTCEQEQPSLRTWYNGQEYRLLKRGELERCRKAALVLVTSERERKVLKGLLPESVVEVVSNGVDLEAFARDSAVQEAPHQIVFTGTMDYHPNTQAALFFAERCWPLVRRQIPDATWQIVGRNPPPEIQRLAHLPGVIVTGEVPDVRPYLASAALAIAPLLIGGGTRLKILEAFAMQKAVVSTSLGCEGIAVEPGKHLVVEDQPEAFAEAIIRLLEHPEQRAAYGAAGRALVETIYSWERCGADLLRALENRFSHEGLRV
jgi:sugar transferase (PEP-CTERM/EpsH1 system associated)